MVYEVHPDSKTMTASGVFSPPKGNIQDQAPVAASRSEEDQNAGFVMATNSSSIVSKRSVERLYLPEPHYFRHFVRKPQRRAPVINRGYWLRMKAIEHVVRGFLHQPTNRKKVVINLGCGYDPMPFQWLGQSAEACKDVVFIDIDYRDLMLSKVNVVNNTPQIKDLLGNAEVLTGNDSMLFQSDRYSIVGCDLGDTKALDHALQALPWLCDRSILFVAEVSITYMELDKADRLIEWASKLGSDNQFCLLEQILPDGPMHPFANTMLRHFKKLRSPLRCIDQYPSVDAQKSRFRDRGWKHVEAQNLWALWSDESFLNRQERLSLEDIEPFDEWEEFALFASHYFLLHASNSPVLPIMRSSSLPPTQPIDPTFSSLRLRKIDSSGRQGHRKHGSAFYLGTDIVGHHGGAEQNGRSSTTDIFCNVDQNESGERLKSMFASLDPRLCHTITVLPNSKCLLVGGRTSPNSSFRDCYLSNPGCQKVQELPSGRYRHSASPVTTKNGSSAVLVYGGKENTTTIVGDWLLWNEDSGWTSLKMISGRPVPRFGASLVNYGSDHGILLGGISDDGVILQDIWTWCISYNGNQVDGVRCEKYSDVDAPSEVLPWICRFGAAHSFDSDTMTIIGGIAQSGCLPEKFEVLQLRLVDKGSNQHRSLQLEISLLDRSVEATRPLLVGHSSTQVGPQETLILGGGAVCFSFGSYWNSGLWVLEDKGTSIKAWSMLQTQAATLNNGVSQKIGEEAKRPETNHQPCAITDMALRRQVHTASEFDDILRLEQPCVMEGLDFGQCVQRWNDAYLEAAVGSDRPVIIHEASAPMMSFHTKDFKYVTKSFGEFLRMAQNGSKVYLRSLSMKNKSDLPAQFHEDFPGLSADFVIPEPLHIVSENTHSSPFRISTAGIWLHYDVQANCLFQVRGSKTLILFPPQDILRLSFPPGSTTSSTSIFDSFGGLQIPEGTRPVAVHLKPGEILFIPPLWPHTAAPVQGVSVAVNVFFRNLNAGYAAGRDVYGNRDLQAYENGRKQVDKIVKSFAHVPPTLAHVYIARLAEELRSKAMLPSV